MTKPHRIGNQDFFSILSKVESANSDRIFHFPLEYFSDDNAITLYKVVESVCMATKIVFSRDSEGEDPYVLFDDTPYSFDQFISMLAKNYGAMQLLDNIYDDEEFTLRRR